MTQEQILERALYAANEVYKAKTDGERHAWMVAYRLAMSLVTDETSDAVLQAGIMAQNG